MDMLTREYINELAELIIEIYDIRVPIKNIDEIVKKLGGCVDNEKESLYDGTIEKVDQDSFCIKVSPYQSERRKNFTVAHELGHLFLHMGYKTNPQIWESHESGKKYQRSGTTEQEYQANEFAASLLMPKKKFIAELRKHTDKNGRIDISAVARHFNVSFSAAVNRGRFLRYIK